MEGDFHTIKSILNAFSGGSSEEQANNFHTIKSILNMRK